MARFATLKRMDGTVVVVYPENTILATTAAGMVVAACAGFGEWPLAMTKDEAEAELNAALHGGETIEISE